MPRWLGLTSRAMSSTASGTTPSRQDRQIKLLFPDRPIGDGVRAYGNDNHANAVVLPELAGIGPFGVHQVGSHRSLCNYLDGYKTPDVAAIIYVAVHKIREQA